MHLVLVIVAYKFVVTLSYVLNLFLQVERFEWLFQCCRKWGLHWTYDI